MNLLKNIFYHIWGLTIVVFYVSLNKQKSKTYVRSINVYGSIDMTPSTQEMSKNKKPVFQKLKSSLTDIGWNFFLGYRMRINLNSGLVKPGDQALILISTFQKFSAQVNVEVSRFLRNLFSLKSNRKEQRSSSTSAGSHHWQR